MAIRVFLADDHAVVRDGLRALLESHSDIEVVGEAADGREALRGVHHLKPDVAVVDVAMPELNGIDLTERLHAECPATRVVILSMHGSMEHVTRALAAGALGYLRKESAGRQVAHAVRAVAAGRRFLCEPVQEMVARNGHGFRSPLTELSAREREVLQLVVEGHSSAAIAERLYLSPKTVDTYRSRLMRKLGVGSIPELVKFAILHGITTAD